MKFANSTLFAVAAISLFSCLTVSATESTDEVRAAFKSLRHLATGEKPVKGVKKEKKVKVRGDSDKKEKMPTKVKDDSEKKEGKVDKGESNGGKAKEEGGKVNVPKVKETNDPKEAKTDAPSGFIEASIVPSDISSVSPATSP